MKHETAFNHLRKHPGITAAVLTGAVALAGCGASKNNAPEHVAAGETPAAKSIPKKVVSNPEQKSESSNSDVSEILKKMEAAEYSGGWVPILKEETAEEAILWGVGGIKDELKSLGITMDDLKDVLENATPEQLDIIHADPSKPEAEWEHIKPDTEVEPGTGQLHYEFIF